MNKEPLISKISSKLILKQIFSFLEYKHFFFLIKNNKELQKNLDINFKENIHQNKYIEKIEENELPKKIGHNYQLFKNGIIFGMHYLYFIIHYSLMIYIGK